MEEVNVDLHYYPVILRKQSPRCLRHIFLIPERGKE